MPHIEIYSRENCPEQYLYLGNPDDLDWIAFVPNSMKNEYMPFLEENRFGNFVTIVSIETGDVYFSYHA
jgi:hypothetical protein